MPFSKTCNFRVLEWESKIKSVPVETRVQTDWSVALCMEWLFNRIRNTEVSSDTPPQLCDMSTVEMSLGYAYLWFRNVVKMENCSPVPLSSRLQLIYSHTCAGKVQVTPTLTTPGIHRSFFWARFLNQELKTLDQKKWDWKWNKLIWLQSRKRCDCGTSTSSEILHCSRYWIYTLHMCGVCFAVRSDYENRHLPADQLRGLETHSSISLQCTDNIVYNN